MSSAGVVIGALRVNILDPDRPEQTVQAQVKLLLDMGLHCFP